MKKLTKYQKEEILELLQIRRETVEEDIESATPFEAKEKALDILEEKINTDNMNFTDEEVEWLKDECEMRINVCEANFGNEGFKVQGLANSMQNVIDKIS